MVGWGGYVKPIFSGTDLWENKVEHTGTGDPAAKSSGNNMFITMQLLTLTPSLLEVCACMCVWGGGWGGPATDR